MAGAIALTVLVVFGLLSREHRIAEKQSDVLLLARARTMAIADSSCQASLRLAPNDSVRASIVDACVQLIIVTERAKQK
jgi:hypothetical protein